MSSDEARLVAALAPGKEKGAPCDSLARLLLHPQALQGGVADAIVSRAAACAAAFEPPAGDEAAACPGACVALDALRGLPVLHDAPRLLASVLGALAGAPRPFQEAIIAFLPCVSSLVALHVRSPRTHRLTPRALGLRSEVASQLARPCGGAHAALVTALAAAATGDLALLAPCLEALQAVRLGKGLRARVRSGARPFSSLLLASPLHPSRICH